MKRIWIESKVAEKVFQVSQSTLRRLKGCFTTRIEKQRLFFFYWEIFQYFKLRNNLPDEKYGEYVGVTFASDEVDFIPPCQEKQKKKKPAEVIGRVYEDITVNMTPEELEEYRRPFINCTSCQLMQFLETHSDGEIQVLKSKFSFINLTT